MQAIDEEDAELLRRYCSPAGVAVDGNGNVFVTDTNNSRIEKFACP